MQLDLIKIKKQYKNKFDLTAAYHITMIEKNLKFKKKGGFINRLLCNWAVSIHIKKLENHGMLQRRPTNERPESC